jgi:pyrimidine operon attenuation protein / uracil phosphoribosyltransferase
MNAPLPDPAALLARLASEIRPILTPDTALVGIHTGGAWVAQALHDMLRPVLPHPLLPLGTLDISFYRDDFSRIGLHPEVKPSAIPFVVENQPIILIDDVLHSGRTVRAAMNDLFDYGRAASIKLAVLVDRGGRELPIQPDFCGLRLDIPPQQNVQLLRNEQGQLSLTVA